MIARLLRRAGLTAEAGSLRAQLLRETGVMTALKVAGGVLGFLASLVVARLLGPRGFGHYSYVLAFVQLLVVAVSMGLPQFLVREGAKAPSRLAALRRWADARTLAAGGVAALAMLAAASIPQAAAAGVLFLIAAPLPLVFSLAAVRSALLQSLKLTALSQWPRLALAPTLTIAAAALLWLFEPRVTPAQLMVVTALATVATLAVNSWQLRRRMPVQVPGPALRLSILRALPFMWVSGLFLLNSRIDLMMLGAMAGAESAGTYSVAARVAELASFLMATTNLVLSPHIASLYHSGDKDTMLRLVRRAGRKVLAWSIPIAVVLVVAAEPILAFFFGHEYVEGASALRILVVAQVLIVGSGPLGTLLNMTGGEVSLVKNMAVAVAINAVLNALLIPGLGLEGAAIATASSLILSRWLLLRQAARHFREAKPA